MTPATTNRPNIILTGFMGTGKSTVGRIAASRLGFQFIDTDELIERTHGAITEIFATAGEAAFRRYEAEAAADLAEQSGLVISTGGRLLLDPENAARLTRTGRAFCLSATVDTLVDRLARSASTRPLLAGFDRRDRITALLNERGPGYARFEQIATDGRSPAGVVDELLARVSRPPSHPPTVLPAPEFTASLNHFTEQMGFRIEHIFPADDPAIAILRRNEITVVLDRNATTAHRQTGPIEPPLVLPDGNQSVAVSHLQPDGDAIVGRAGMVYRDLIPDRYGGRFIASHISIADGGPVPDYVHHHDIRFQMIYCARGWAKVVYEDQGEPFVMHEGDCVLQPPHIRHRVLESSAGFEVVEVSCPAEHLTSVDHDLPLPTSLLRPDRVFGGQRFVFHQAAVATWRPWRATGFETCQTAIATATTGLARVQTVRPVGVTTPTAVLAPNNDELLFWFMLRGSAIVTIDGQEHMLKPASSITIPAGLAHTLSHASSNSKFLEVSIGEPSSSSR
jgi:shikimate kinase/quercetin dioxygenase-like cupin family protein